MTLQHSHCICVRYWTVSAELPLYFIGHQRVAAHTRPEPSPALCEYKGVLERSQNGLWREAKVP